MKICTRLALDDDGHVTSILDISLVGDAHAFGLAPGGRELHLEALDVTVDGEPASKP